MFDANDEPPQINTEQVQTEDALIDCELVLAVNNHDIDFML